ncbi:MAG: SIS domain-containing protein [Clostridia bacterium]|nr:SIS domain-containing protein [Clostridia bacterium]
MTAYQKTVDSVLAECGMVLRAIPEESTARLVETLLGANAVFFIGVGRVMLSAQAMAKRLAHLGIRTHVVGEITEPALKPGDVLVVCSGSGETLFPKAIAEKAKSLGARVVMIGSNQQSSIAGMADLMVRMPTNTKFKCADEIPSGQIMTSLFEQCLLLYGDILAKMIVEQRGLDMDSLWEYHANLE